MAFFPGGPPPDSGALPPHSSKPINTRHQAAGSVVIETETHYQGGEIASQRQELADPPPTTTRDSELPPSDDLPPQPPAEHPTTDTSPHGHPLSEEHLRNASAVRIAAPNGGTAEGSLGMGERRSASVASRRTNNVGEYASATGAATAANEPPDVDPSLQPRAASVYEEPKQKATVGKEERAFS
jgi:hypothetical protein